MKVSSPSTSTSPYTGTAIAASVSPAGTVSALGGHAPVILPRRGGAVGGGVATPPSRGRAGRRGGGRRRRPPSRHRPRPPSRRQGRGRRPQRHQRQVVEVGVAVDRGEAGADQHHPDPAGAGRRRPLVAQLLPDEGRRHLARVVGVEDQRVGGVAVLDDDPRGVGRHLVEGLHLAREGEALAGRGVDRHLVGGDVDVLGQLAVLDRAGEERGLALGRLGRRQPTLPLIALDLQPARQLARDRFGLRARVGEQVRARALLVVDDRPLPFGVGQDRRRPGSASDHGEGLLVGSRGGGRPTTGTATLS